MERTLETGASMYVMISMMFGFEVIMSFPDLCLVSGADANSGHARYLNNILGQL